MASIVVKLPLDYVSECSTKQLKVLVDELKTLGTEDDLNSEMRRLVILKELEKRLCQAYAMPIELDADSNQSVSGFPPILLNLTYHFCLIFGFFAKATDGYLYGFSLFSLIPGIGPFALCALTIIYSLLDALMFYAFEVSFLKKAMGMSLSADPACIRNETCMQQINASKKMILLLRGKDPKSLDDTHYDAYCSASRAIEDHLLKKSESMRAYSRTRFKIAAEVFIVSFGGLSTIADSYFMAKTAMLAFHLSFMSSPLICVLIVAMVASALVFYYAMGATGISKLINPDRKSHNALFQKLAMFAKQQKAHDSKFTASSKQDQSVQTDTQEWDDPRDFIFCPS